MTEIKLYWNPDAKEVEKNLQWVPLSEDEFNSTLCNFWLWRDRTGQVYNLWRDFLSYMMTEDLVFGYTEEEIIQTDSQLNEWHKRLLETRPKWFQYPDDIKV